MVMELFSILTVSIVSILMWCYTIVLQDVAMGKPEKRYTRSILFLGTGYESTIISKFKKAYLKIKDAV